MAKAKGITGHVVIRVPVSAVDVDDAVHNCLNAVTKAIAKGASQRATYEWLRDNADVRFVPLSPAEACENDTMAL